MKTQNKVSLGNINGILHWTFPSIKITSFAIDTFLTAKNTILLIGSIV